MEERVSGSKRFDDEFMARAMRSGEFSHPRGMRLLDLVQNRLRAPEAVRGRNTRGAMSNQYLVRTM